MGGKRRKSIRGVSLVEVLITTVVVSMATVGVLSYEYHAARQARMAYARSAAVRIADLLLQDWKANAGSAFYASGSLATVPNPEDLGMGFSRRAVGVYTATVDGIPMLVSLSQGEFPPPGEAVEAIAITVKVQWRRNFVGSVFFANDPSVVLTAYVRADQADG